MHQNNTSYRIQKVQSGTRKINFLDWGHNNKTTLVFLHTDNDRAFTWIELAERMLLNFRIIAIDRSGHGDSDWNTQYDRKTEIEDLDLVLKTLSLDQFVLVGHGKGGLIAVDYAARFSEKLLGLVIIDSDLNNTGSGLFADKQFAATRKWASKNDLKQHIKALQPESTEESILRQVEYLTRACKSFRVWISDQKAISFFDYTDITDKWTSVKCPAMLLRGRRSKVLTHENAVKIRELLSKVKLVELEGAGYWAHHETTAAVESALLWFVSQIVNDV